MRFECWLLPVITHSGADFTSCIQPFHITYLALNAFIWENYPFSEELSWERMVGWQITEGMSFHANCSSHLGMGMFWGWSQLLAGTQSFRHSKARADWETQPFPSPLYGTDFSKGDNPARRGYTDNTQQHDGGMLCWNPLIWHSWKTQISQICDA